MIILAIDPSSTKTGYAALDSLRGCTEDGMIIDAGLVSGSRQGDKVARIIEMGHEIDLLIRQYRPERVIIESTSAHVFKRHGKMIGSGLAVYGHAVGFIHAVAERHELDPIVVCIDAVTWTAGRPKKERTRELQLISTRYLNACAGGSDSGGDVGDAILLGLWYLRQQEVEAKP